MGQEHYMETELPFRERLLHQQQRLLAEIHEERVRSMADISDQVLAWLILPPDWTLRLAEACSFPCISSSTVSETFQRLAEERLYTHQTSDEGESYIVSNATRKELRQQLIDKNGHEWLLHEMQSLGAIMLKLRGGQTGLAPGRERWGELASRAVNPREVTNKLNEEK